MVNFDALNGAIGQARFAKHGGARGSGKLTAFGGIRAALDEEGVPASVERNSSTGEYLFKFGEGERRSISQLFWMWVANIFNPGSKSTAPKDPGKSEAAVPAAVAEPTVIAPAIKETA